MENNDIFRRLRYILNLKDAELVEILALADEKATINSVKSWLKKEGENDFRAMTDKDLSAFLNGIIVKKRGAKDGAKTINEVVLNNNLILRKLKIAFNLKDVDMIEIFDLADMRVSKGELSAFFRSTNHKHYRECMDQFLRNFLLGLQLKLRPKSEKI